MSQSLYFRAAYNEASGGATTYEHKLTCKRCGLRFVVYSWNPEWPVVTPEEARRCLAEGWTSPSRGSLCGTPVCPQCGSARRTAATFTHKVEASEDPIFRHMSGRTRWLWIRGRPVEVKTQIVEIPLDQLDTATQAMTQTCAWCGSSGPVRAVSDIFGRVHMACTPSCPMTLERALIYVDDVAGPIISRYGRSGMAGAVKHVLTEAVLAGVRFRDEAAVLRWLGQHAGLKALEVASL